MKTHLLERLGDFGGQLLDRAAEIGLDDLEILAAHGEAPFDLVLLKRQKDALAEDVIDEHLDRISTSIRLLAARMPRGADITLMYPLSIGLLGVRKASESLEQDDLESAVDWIAMAAYGLGAFTGHQNGGTFVAEQELRSLLGRKGAEKRHEETRNIREQVHQWCEAHLSAYRSLDAAAEAVIAQRLAPITFRTARKYVGEWRKLHSAGKA